MLHFAEQLCIKCLVRLEALSSKDTYLVYGIYCFVSKQSSKKVDDIQYMLKILVPSKWI